MLAKYFNCVLSVFVVILCITSIRSDVSHIVSGPATPVNDPATMDLLKQNIGEYLAQLAHGGSPQMQLQQINSATKQTVTGTLYTVQAVLATPDGSKNCQIRVLEKPWIDFCQVRVTCENGGQYEVTFNPHQNSHDIPQPGPTYLPPPTTPAYVRPTPAPFQFKPQPPVYQPQPAPTYQPPPPPVYKPQPPPPPPPQPQPTYKPQFDIRTPIQQPQHDFPIKNGVPNPVFPKAPELNVLPFDQLPQGPALEKYLHGLFDDFMGLYKRQYIDEPNEQAYRYNVFTENFHAMHENQRADSLACQYSVTEFSDLTQDEFSHIMGFQTEDLRSLDGADGANGTFSSDADIASVGDLPEKYDQRDENLVTKVKFQGDCGACWAFVTTAVIEGLCAKKTKKLQEFSEQSLIDCDKANFGCKGGVPPKAMKHIAKRGGLELQSVYPFVYAQSTCKFQKKNVRVKVSGVVGFKKNDEVAMAKWLFKNGPILVGINADPLKYYKKGVMNPTPALCNPKKVNHGVTLIGFGVELDTSTGEKLPYWIAKNQWGTRFGEDGYFRIARGKNACGIALWANSVKLASDPNNCLLDGA